MDSLRNFFQKKEADRPTINDKDWLKMEILAEAFKSGKRKEVERVAEEFARRYLGLQPGKKLRELPDWISDDVLQRPHGLMSVPDDATDSCIFVMPENLRFSLDCPEFFKTFNQKAAGKRWRLDVRMNGKRREGLALPELVSEYSGLPASEQDHPQGFSKN